MWRIVKQSDRETMVDELRRLKPLEDPMDQEQRERAVVFVISELQAGDLDGSINLSGDWVDENNNYLSIIIGSRPSTTGWSFVKSAGREQLISSLSNLTPSSEQQARAVKFALIELEDTDEQFGSVNMSGDPESGFLSLSVSAAE